MSRFCRVRQIFRARELEFLPAGSRRMTIRFRSPNRVRWRRAQTLRRRRSEEHTSELQSLRHLVCRLLLEKKKKKRKPHKTKYPQKVEHRKNDTYTTYTQHQKLT